VNRFDRTKVLWNGLSRSGRIRLAIAIFLTFSSLGFATDLFNLRETPTPLALGLRIVFTGLVSVGYFIAITRSRWLLIPATLFQILGVMALDRFAPARVLAPGSPIPMGVLQSRVLIDAVGIMIVIALAYSFFIQVLSGEGIRSARLLAEMSLAQDIHSSLVPPIALETAGLEIYGRSAPSSEVGGDLVDAFDHRGAVTVCVADVAGHGVRAGTLMAMVRSAVRMKLLEATRLDGLLADLNQVLIQLRRPDMFVTIACLRVAADGAVEVALAGHPPVLQVCGADGTVRALANQHVPLGVRDGEGYPVAATTLGPGDLLALYTDGLTEVMDRSGVELGLAPIESTLVAGRVRPLAEVFDQVMHTVRAHGPQKDDQTLLLVRARARS
jgi:serine phosphatase RsbU (regulator of sigma subunit)